MVPFAEFAAENFFHGVNLMWNLRGDRFASSSFTVGTVKVVVSFEQREQNAPWHVLFEVERGEAQERTHLAFHIFSGVFQAVREFVEVREPEAMVFATKRDELAGVYRAYLRRERAALEELGYELEPERRVEPYAEFVLRRLRPSGWKQ